MAARLLQTSKGNLHNATSIVLIPFSGDQRRFFFVKRYVPKWYGLARPTTLFTNRPLPKNPEIDVKTHTPGIALEPVGYGE